MNRSEKIKYSRMIESYVREIAPGKYVDEITELVRSRYGGDESINTKYIKCYINRKKIKTGMAHKTRRDKNPKTVFRKEQLDFIRAHYNEWNNDRMYKEIQSRWPDLPGLTYSSLLRVRRNYKLNYKKYTKDMDEYIKANIWKDYTTLARELSENFDRNIKRKDLTAYISYRGLTPGKRPGTNPQKRRKKIGDERYRKSNVHAKGDIKFGYWEVKVAEPDVWKPKARVMWEQYHNKTLPDDYIVVQLDKNHDNFAEENLMAVPKNIMGIVNSKSRLAVESIELARAGVNLSHLEMLLNKRKKENKQNP